MAGSYEHIVTEDGRLLNPKHFVGMIENLGDAYEMAEELYGMVQLLANSMVDLSLSNWGRADYIRWAQERYKDGLHIGGVEPG